MRLQEPPRTATERAVAEFWREATGNPHIGRYQTFYEIGGGSLNLLEVLNELSWQFGVDLNAVALLEHPTVVGIAQHIDRQLAVNAQPQSSRSPNRYPPHTPLPLSLPQERLLRLEQSFGRVQPICIAFSFTGPLQTNALKRACAQIVQRHGALRTRIAGSADEPRQVVHEQRFELEEITAPEPSSVDLLTWLRELSTSMAQEMSGPRASLFRVVLVKVHEQEHAMLVVAHRMVCDVWSLCMMLPWEISMRYSALLRDEPEPFKELSCQYGQYASWQRDWLQTELGEKEASHWRALLQDPPDASERPPVSGLADALPVRHVVQWPKQMSERISNLACDQSVSRFAVLAAACAVVLSGLLARDHLRVESINTGRHMRELEPLMGCFVSSIFVDVSVPADVSFSTVLRRLSSALIETFSQQFVAIDAIVSGAGASRQSAFAVALHRQMPVQFEMPRVHGSCSLPPRMSSAHAIALDFYESEAGLECECTCQAASTTITPQRLLSEIASLLDALTSTSVERRIAELRPPVSLPAQREPAMENLVP